MGSTDEKTSIEDQITAEAADVLYESRNLVTRECFRLCIKAAIEKALSGQRIYGEWGTAVVIDDEFSSVKGRAAHGTSAVADASEQSHCVKHNTYPKPDEPCWQCIVEHIPAHASEPWTPKFAGGDAWRIEGSPCSYGYSKQQAEEICNAHNVAVADVAELLRVRKLLRENISNSEFAEVITEFKTVIEKAHGDGFKRGCLHVLEVEQRESWFAAKDFVDTGHGKISVGTYKLAKQLADAHNATLRAAHASEPWTTFCAGLWGIERPGNVICPAVLSKEVAKTIFNAHNATLSQRPTPATYDTVELLDWAWTLLANAGGGDWTKESKDWQEAVAKWRDEYYKNLSERRKTDPQCNLPSLSQTKEKE